MRVFITGGNGQIGSTVAEILLAQGDTVMSIDNFATGRRDNLVAQSNLTQVEDTITNADTVERLFADFEPDVVVHTAASYKDSEDWGSDAMVNAGGTAIVAKAAKAHKVRRIVYFQTALCYGTKPIQRPIRLDHPINPVNSSYAISKTAGENYVQFSGVDWVSFRLANVIGERNVSGPLPIFYSRLTQGKRCFVTPARRDFCYAGDLAKVVVRAAHGTGRGAYHFSTGTDVAIRELYDAMVRALKINDYPEPEERPLGPDDAASILLEPSRTFTDFGAQTFTPLDEIVRRAVDRWSAAGVAGGYTHLKEARGEIKS